MKIRNIELKNYRNYENEKISFEKDFNYIYGSNGQGKTNLLEAIYICSTTKSHRNSKDNELINFGKSYYSITIELENEDYNKKVKIVYKSGQRKNIEINDIKIKKSGELMGVLNAVLFAPESLMLVKGSPLERRRFIDILISQIKPTYYYSLQNYNRLLKQKNSLLKEIALGNINKSQLDLWNNLFVEGAIEILKIRNEYVSKIENSIRDNHYIISDNKEILDVKYNATVDIKNIHDKIEQIKDREIITQTSLIGPHRDDLDIKINSKPAKFYASQGQIRSAVLAIKMSEIELIRNENNISPVLLLDDVMSELDDKRKRYMFEMINDTQIFITGTEKFKNNMDISYYNVNEGKIMWET